MTASASLFRHIVFPGQLAARPVVDVALQPAARWSAEREIDLPEAEGKFVDWLLAQAGLRTADYRSETLLRRLPACLRSLHAATIAEARATLERSPQLIPKAVDVMLVGVTSFFRDPAVFEQLRAHVLPQLARSRRGLYIWCVGCSEGAEVYSLAILLAELGLLDHSYLLGTDCRLDAIERLRSAWYPEASLTGLAPAYRERYFVPEAKGWVVRKELQRHVHARRASVLDQVEPGLWDVIVCRNTSIYLRVSAAQRLWQRLEAALRPGGAMVLGKAERPVAALRLQPHSPCIFLKTRQ